MKRLLWIISACMACYAAPAWAAQGPAPGKYACYNYGFGFQSFYNGVTVVIERGNRYTTRGASFTGLYRYNPSTKSIVFLSGKLRGLRSWYRPGAPAGAILIAFRNGNATNTAVCGRIR